jgi:hypothetical protein
MNIKAISLIILFTSCSSIRLTTPEKTQGSYQEIANEIQSLKGICLSLKIKKFTMT